MRLLLTLLFFVSAISVNAQSPNWLWAEGAGGANNDQGRSVVTDVLGNVYAFGEFTSPTITFGSYTLSKGLSSSGIFLVKYDASGNVIWAVKPSGEAYSASHTIDDAGNIYISGFFYGTLTFGGTFLNTSGSGDMFLAKYDASGNVIWAKRHGGTNIDYYMGIVADTMGNIFTTGSFSSTSIIFDSYTLTNSNSIGDIFVAKYDTTGTVQWAVNIGGLCTSQCRGIDTDNNGNCFITGYFFNSSITFDFITLTNVGGTDIFTVMYDGSGAVQWAKREGASGDQYGNTLAVDGNGYVYAIGSMASSFTAGSTPLTVSGPSDMYLICYTPAGLVSWAKRIGGAGDENGFGITTDAGNNVYIGGCYTGPYVAFGTDTLFNTGTGANEVMIVKYTSAGVYLWSKDANGGGSDIVNGLADDVFGNMYVTGWHSSITADFDGDILTGAGAADFFLGKLAPITTGISASGEGLGMNVYPNPFSESLTVTFDHDIRDVKLFLYDMMGRELKTMNISGERAEFKKDESLLPGMYLLQVMEAGQRVGVFRVVLK